VAARCPCLIYIFRAHGIAAELTLELLISNPLEPRAPMAPALVERVSRPLVSNRTLRGFDFSSPGLRPREGHAYLVRDKAIKCPRFVAVVVRRGRAFSGDATACVVGDVGGGRDGPPRPFGCHAVMIARARAPGRFGDVGPAHQR
jgi:hypothetical protein